MPPQWDLVDSAPATPVGANRQTGHFSRCRLVLRLSSPSSHCPQGGRRRAVRFGQAKEAVESTPRHPAVSCRAVLEGTEPCTLCSRPRSTATQVRWCWPGKRQSGHGALTDRNCRVADQRRGLKMPPQKIGSALPRAGQANSQAWGLGKRASAVFAMTSGSKGLEKIAEKPWSLSAW